MPRWFILTFVLLLATPAAAQTSFDLFNGNLLHEIRIDIHPADWQQLRTNFLENTYYPADVRWLHNGRYVEVEQTAVRSRGTGSRSGVKPGLLVDFDRYNSSQRFLGLQSIVLRNNTQDASMLHERVAFALMERMGIPVPRVAHTRLYVNNQYMGLYTLVESIDQTFLKERFNDEQAYLYEYDYDREDLPYFLEYRGADPRLYSPKPFQPETHETDPQVDKIAAMIRTVNEVSDIQFENAVSEYLDLKVFVAGLAVEAYLAEQDGIIGDYGLNNFYLYRQSASNRFLFLPWDKSQTFLTVDRSPWTNIEFYVLSRRSLAIPALKDAFVSALVSAALLGGGPGGWLEQEMLRQYNQVREAARQDVFKQCDPPQSGTLRQCTNEEFEAGVANMLRFARERNIHIARYLQDVLKSFPTFGHQSFDVPDLGGIVFRSSGATGSLVSGHARLQPVSSVPVGGMAIVGFRQNNVLVTEATVPAVALLRTGRIYAEVNDAVKTGIAIANPNSQPVLLTFYFSDSSGRDFGHGSTTIPAEGQVAGFLDEAPFNSGTSVSGTFTFTASRPMGVAALRGFINERSEFLVTTLPVADLFSVSPTPSVISHFADGGGWSTQVILVNSGDFPISGAVQFWSSGSESAPAGIVSSSTYSIAPRSSFRILSAGTAAETRTGSVRLVATDRLPRAMTLFSFKANGVTVTEAGAAATAQSSALRIYVEVSGGSVQSGVAIANTSNIPVLVNFEVTTLSGQATGLKGATAIPANGQISLFLNEIPGFFDIPPDFHGVLRVLASTPSISAVGIRGRYNERGDYLITTTPPVPETASPATELSIPLVLDSGGYETQIILYSAYPGGGVAGVLRYRSRDGQSLDLRLK